MPAGHHGLGSRWPSIRGDNQQVTLRERPSDERILFCWLKADWWCPRRSNCCPAISRSSYGGVRTFSDNQRMDKLGWLQTETSAQYRVT
jgi:hypothetical protein